MPNKQDRSIQGQPASHSRRGFLAATAATAGFALKPAFAAGQDLTSMTLKAASDMLRRKTVSPLELTQACLERIKQHNSALNAFITVTGDEALKTAREMASEQQKGKWRGPLHGVPIALKDNIDTAGVRTTAASELFKNRVPTEDADVARRLKNAGAILLGKLNLHEFAYGGTSDITYFGAVHNPWALDHISGGSSGGSAVAISADLCYGSLGTDTAGVGSDSILILRSRRIQAHLWARESSGSDSAFMDARSLRSDLQDGGGRRFDAAGDCRL